MTGWVKLPRKLLDWRWFKNPSTWLVFSYLLLKANYIPGQWQELTIYEGQHVTSISTISSGTGLSVQQVRTALNKLKSTGEITVKSTSKFSLITLVNWEEYQQPCGESNKYDNTGQSKRATYGQQTTNNQSTTIEEGKTIKNLKKEKERACAINENANIRNFPGLVNAIEG